MNMIPLVPKQCKSNSEKGKLTTNVTENMVQFSVIKMKKMITECGTVTCNILIKKGFSLKFIPAASLVLEFDLGTC